MSNVWDESIKFANKAMHTRVLLKLLKALNVFKSNITMTDIHDYVQRVDCELEKRLKNGDYFDRLGIQIGLSPDETWQSHHCVELLRSAKRREVIREYYRLQNKPHYRDDHTEIWCNAIEDYMVELMLLKSETT